MAAAGGVSSKSELLNVLGDVKARVQDRLGIVDFPMPQFILIGKQSVGKSRLIEALAGECFNFISGTLGSRRPTILEFRNVVGPGPSRWFVRDRASGQWQEHPIAQVMQLVGAAHEELGETVTAEPISVRLESPTCVDMQIVDLPGFRDFALDASKQHLAERISDLVGGFMQDPRNVMLCVEQAGDAATMSTLARARQIDPEFKRTILVRNKLDKYYSDLTPENISNWVDGFGDLPPTLVRFALTLPWWMEGTQPSKAFAELREEFNTTDQRTVQAKGLSMKYMATIGFNAFAQYMSKKIEDMFVGAIGPVLGNLKGLKDDIGKNQKALESEFADTDPMRILNTTRECGTSFSQALRRVMDGVIGAQNSTECSLDEELREFHQYHDALKSEHFERLPAPEFAGVDEYIEYLEKEVKIGAFAVKINGGAQFSRVLREVEIFLRFSEIAVEIKKKDVIQARGISMSSLTWRDVIVKLLSNEAHVPLQKRVEYVGERVKWFFEQQKEAVLEFMGSLEGTPTATLENPLFPKYAKLIKSNELIKHLIWQSYDAACQRQLRYFTGMFENMLTSTFSNPWVFLKGATIDDAMNMGADGQSAAGKDVLNKIPAEIQSRSGIEAKLSTWLQDIPTESHQIDEAVDKVQMLVLKTYSFIRSQVCDQVELFVESFFKTPMMRILEQDMSLIELSDADRQSMEQRRARLQVQMQDAAQNMAEIDQCIERIEVFKLKCEARAM